MRLRKQCEHGFFDAHRLENVQPWQEGLKDWPVCPGGEFLADDALEQLERDAYARGLNWRAFETGDPIAVEHEGEMGWWIPAWKQPDILTVRKGAE